MTFGLPRTPKTDLRIGLHNAIVLLAVSLLQTFTIPSLAQAAPLSKTAVVLIDMQEPFLREDKARDELITSQIRLLEWAKANDLPVLVFEYIDEGRTIWPLRKYINEFERHRYAIKTKDGGFCSPFHPDHNPVEILKDWGVEKLIISGVQGPWCVRNTVDGALRKGFSVYSSSDIVAFFSEETSYYPDDFWKYPVSISGGSGFRINREKEFHKFHTLSELMVEMENENRVAQEKTTFRIACQNFLMRHFGFVGQPVNRPAR